MRSTNQQAIEADCLYIISFSAGDVPLDTPDGTTEEQQKKQEKRIFPEDD